MTYQEMVAESKRIADITAQKFLDEANKAKTIADDSAQKAIYTRPAQDALPPD